MKVLWFVLTLFIFSFDSSADVFKFYDGSGSGSGSSSEFHLMRCRPFTEIPIQTWTWDGRLLKLNGEIMSNDYVSFSKGELDLMFVVEFMGPDIEPFAIYLDFKVGRMAIPRAGVFVKCLGRNSRT